MIELPPGPGDCPFCDIAAGRTNARIVWRSDSIIAFLPDVPAVDGHTLVVPARHVRDIWGVDAYLGWHLADATRHVAEGVAAAVGTKNLNIIQSNGVAAGQSVFHLHIHVVPRRTGDRMPELWPPDAEWPAQHLDHVAANISEALTPTEHS